MGIKIIYDGLELNQLGEVSVATQREEFGPTPLALSRRVVLHVRVSVTQPGWADNYELIQTLRGKLRKQQAVLQWLNENGQEILNRTVAVESCDLPEEANAPGTRFQQADLTFSYETFDLTGEALQAVVTSSDQQLVLGSVLEWEEGLSVSRFDEQRSERKRSAYQATAKGFVAANTALPLATRREQLQAAQAELLARLDQKEIRLQYGGFDRTVRVTRFTATVNQMVDKIEWSFTAEFTRFPNEADYATIEYRISKRDDGADQVLSISGKVDAESTAKARNVISPIVAAMLTSYGFSAALQVRDEDEEGRASANADGDTFITYSFLREFRKPLVNTMTVQRPGGPVTTLGNVTRWEEEEATERFAPMKNIRRQVMRRLRLTGQRFAATNVSVETRRAELLAVKAAWDAEFNSPTVTLVYGSFSKAVRVTERKAEIDEAVRALVWTVAAEFSVLPDETDYATIDYQVSERNDGADRFITFSGRIQATDEAKARAKLAAIRQTVLAGRNYSAALALRQDDEVSSAEGSDGSVFVELGFTEEYRRVLENVVKYQPTDGEAINLGNLTAWRQGFDIARYHKLRDPRQEIIETVTLEGQSFANAQDSLEVRRTQLAGIREAWVEKLASQSGQLTYGTFDKKVRVTSFRADMDHAVKSLTWSLVVEYARYPNETDYAAVEYQVTERDEGADKLLTINGRVMASGLVKARTKLAELIAAVVTGRGYDPKLKLRDEGSTAEVATAGDGDVFLELSFTQEFRLPLENTITFQVGEDEPVTLGNVTTWQDGYRAARYSPLHSERSYAGGVVSAKGQYFVDITLSLEQRTAALMTLKEQWMTAFNVKDGVLVHGDFNRTVRVSEFTVELDQARRSLVWTLSAEFSRFPNEEGYAFVEYTTRKREDAENGQVAFVFTGRIMAHTAAAAYDKLTALRASVLAGNTNYVQLRRENSENKVDGVDGQAFLELNFDEEFQLGASSTLRWEVTVTTADDAPSGLQRLTYSGTVTARGADYATAEAAAKAKARELGGNKAQMLKTQSIGVQDRLTLTTTGERLVTVSFNFEYQVKGPRVFWEVQSETVSETFGESSDRVTGYVVAATQAAAEAIYRDKVKTLFAGRLPRGEQTGMVREYLSRMDLATGNVVAGEYEEMWLRLSFSFNVHREKTLDETAMRYDISVQPDDLTNLKTITLSGTVWAKDMELDEAGGVVRPSGKKTKAEKVLEDFLTGISTWLGVLQRREYREKQDVFLGNTSTPDNAVKKCMALEFTLTYTAKLTDADKVLMCELSETVEHTGVRWVVQNIPDGRPIVQNCGYNAGGRTISGKVVATSPAAAEAWMRAQRTLLAGDYELPPNVQRDFRFLPLQAGVVSGAGSNVMAYETSFRFAEILLEEDFV